jgi:uncharacterized protein (DUF1810 family)
MMDLLRLLCVKRSPPGLQHERLGRKLKDCQALINQPCRRSTSYICFTLPHHPQSGSSRISQV